MSASALPAGSRAQLLGRALGREGHVPHRDQRLQGRYAAMITTLRWSPPAASASPGPGRMQRTWTWAPLCCARPLTPPSTSPRSWHPSFHALTGLPPPRAAQGQAPFGWPQAPLGFRAPLVLFRWLRVGKAGQGTGMRACPDDRCPARALAPQTIPHALCSAGASSNKCTKVQLID